jgi:hypothetical protein
MRSLLGLRRRTAESRGLLDVEVELPSDGVLRVDHYCPAASMHRLLGVEATEGERGALRAGRDVALVVRCDRCLWERRLLLR